MMPLGFAGVLNRRSGERPVVLNDGEPSELPLPYARQASGVDQLIAVDVLPSACLSRPKYQSSSVLTSGAYPLFKRSIDIVGACVALLCLWPLIVSIIAFGYLTGGSPLFRHRRVGLGGVLFDCVKFRTMVIDSDKVLQNILNVDRQAREEWLRDHKLRNDPRITRFGRLLRRTSLDELPQLWNVLRGDMSLVGPRPVVPDELCRYGKQVSTLLSARPCITGLWQISGRNNTDYRRRVALDVYYVRSRCVLLDTYIMAKTLHAVFNRKGAY